MHQVVNWESARFSRPIIGLAEPIDDRLRNWFVGLSDIILKISAHRPTVGRGSDIGSDHRFIRDIDQNLSDVDVVLSPMS